MRRITSFQYYSMLDSFHIASCRRRHRAGGHGSALAVLDKVAAATPASKSAFSEAPAGAGHYRDTGKSDAASTIKLCEEADAILLGACGPCRTSAIRQYRDMPQVELRSHLRLYAGCGRAG